MEFGVVTLMPTCEWDTKDAKRNMRKCSAQSVKHNGNWWFSSIYVGLVVICYVDNGVAWDEGRFGAVYVVCWYVIRETQTRNVCAWCLDPNVVSQPVLYGFFVHFPWPGRFVPVLCVCVCVQEDAEWLSESRQWRMYVIHTVRSSTYVICGICCRNCSRDKVATCLFVWFVELSFIVFVLISIIRDDLSKQ